MRTKAFPEEWPESQTLIDKLAQEDRRFEDDSNAEINGWRPQTLDDKGNIKPDEARRLAAGFVQFLHILSAKVLRVYTASVEDDTRRGFTKLQEEYQGKLKGILGEMPDDLKKFLKKMPVLSPIELNPRVTEIEVQKTIEKYQHRYRRPITIEEDGILRKVLSILPFTDTEKLVEETRYRKREFVEFSVLKDKAEHDASLVLLDGHEHAKAAAANTYAELRKLMMEQFDKFDEKLKSFKNDLNHYLDDQKGKREVLRECNDTLEWVRRFQDDLSHILDFGV